MTAKPYIFIIHSLGKFKEEISVFKESLNGTGLSAYDPEVDTDQVDPTGYRICQDNARAIRDSVGVAVFWDGESHGSLFDMGVAFAFNKPIWLGSAPQPKATKCIASLLGEWHTKGRSFVKEPRSAYLCNLENLLLKSPSGKPLAIVSTLKTNDDGSYSFDVATLNAKEFYRHTIKTEEC